MTKNQKENQAKQDQKNQLNQSQQPQNAQNHSQDQQSDLQKIEQYLETFRYLKYGVLEKVLEADKVNGNHNKLIVIEAPRFIGDMQPVCEPAYFDYREDTPTEMLEYYLKCEALVHQRFEQLQVRYIMENLKKLVCKIEYDENLTQAYVVFGGKCHPPFPSHTYDLNAMELGHFIHDLMDYGDHCAKHACSGTCGIYFSTIFHEIAQNIDLSSLHWQVINNPWDTKAADPDLIIRMPFARRNVNSSPWTVRYSNDAEGALCLVMRLFRTLTQNNLRDFIPNPNDRSADLVLD